jgi:hypothetical protein
MSQSLISAVFDDRADAERAVTELRDAGVREDALSIVGRPDESDVIAADVDHDGHGKGEVAASVAAGGVVGAILGIGALAIPGVGPLVAAGAIAASAVPTAAAVGAAVGATGGALAKMLTDHDVDGRDATFYEERITAGGVFVSVDARQTDVPAETVGEILRRFGGQSPSRTETATV